MGTSYLIEVHSYSLFSTASTGMASMGFHSQGHLFLQLNILWLFLRYKGQGILNLDPQHFNDPECPCGSQV